jgi:hypothetical protein
MLEHYHAAVLRAHKEHSGVTSRIPVPLPPMPAEDEVEPAALTPHITRTTEAIRPPDRPDVPS